jgi:transposase-like protein
VAKELGVDSRRICQWRKEAEQRNSNTTVGKKYLKEKAEKKSERALAKEYRRLIMENEILKKAIAFISERDV